MTGPTDTLPATASAWAPTADDLTAPGKWWCRGCDVEWRQPEGRGPNRCWICQQTDQMRRLA